MVLTLVILTVIASIIVGYLIQQKRSHISKKRSVIKRPEIIDRIFLPQGYFLSKGHCWAEVAANGSVRIGFDDFIHYLLGRIDSIEVPEPNTELKKGEPLFTVHQGMKSLSFPSPFSGKLVNRNPALEKSTEVLTRDPYLTGWIAVVRPSKLDEEVKQLVIGETAVSWVKQELLRFREFIKENVLTLMGDKPAKPAMATALDGGFPIEGILEQTDIGTWKAFEQAFLRLS